MSSVERAGIHLEQAAVHLDSAASSLERGRLGGYPGGVGQAQQMMAGGPGDWVGPVMRAQAAEQQSRARQAEATTGKPLSPSGQSAPPALGPGGLAPGVVPGRYTGGQSPVPGSVPPPSQVGSQNDTNSQAAKILQVLDKARDALASFGATLMRLNRDFVSIASPNAYATLTGSLDMIKARIGSYLIPTIDTAGKGLQQISAVMDLIPQQAQGMIGKGVAVAAGGTVGGVIGTAAGATVGSVIPGLGTSAGAVIGWTIGAAAGASLTAYLMGQSGKMSMGGLPQPTVGSAESYWEAGAMRSLSLGSGTVEQDIYRKQLEELQKIGGLLAELKNAPRETFPAYR